MKKTTALLLGLYAIAFISCKKEDNKPAIKHTIEVTPALVEEVKDSISVQTGKDGVDINTKSGSNSNTISVGSDAKTEVEVK